MRTSTIALVLVLAACDSPQGPAVVTDVDITQDSVLLTSIGDSVRLSANVTDDSDRSVSAELMWQSDRTDVATVNEDGIVVARGTGTARVTAAHNNVEDDVIVVVRQRVALIKRWSVAVLRPGETGRLEFEAVDTRGHVVAAPRFSVTVTQPYIASIDTTGVVSAFAIGVSYAHLTADEGQAVVALNVREPFDSLSAGGRITCARAESREVYCWGAGFSIPTPELNIGGQLAANPSLIVGPSGRMGFSQITAGDVHACGIANDGSAWCWGDARYTGAPQGGTVAHRVGTGTFRTLSAGDRHSCGISTAGSTYCWGDRDSPALAGLTFGPDGLALVDANPSFVSLAAGGTHTCAVAADASVWCWGANTEGQLGNGTPDAVPHPQPVRVASTQTFTAVTAGARHSCAIASGDVYCWGDNFRGQLGIGEIATQCPTSAVSSRCVGTPTRVVLTQPGATIVDAGAEHTCALLQYLWCWGNRRNGRTGINYVAPETVPAVVSFLWTYISVGGTHVCGWMHTLGCFGSNEWGQIPPRIGGEDATPGDTGFGRSAVQ
jgi:alpha-tubulin suppressor-like RCC1 family protein